MSAAVFTLGFSRLPEPHLSSADTLLSEVSKLRATLADKDKKIETLEKRIKVSFFDCWAAVVAQR